jgi:hypothetical protein
MIRTLIFCLPLLLAEGVALADDAAPAAAVAEKIEPGKQGAKAASDRKGDRKEGAQDHGDVEMSGMSILGNDEAPKALVIVPWKSSQLGDAPGLAKLLDDSTQPVDKEVFMRELAYYRIRSESK